jgi:outer membrane lipoprotein LolB
VRRRAAIAALAVLAGCATTKPPADAVSGKLSIRIDAAGTQPARSVTSDFELRGDAERGELRLTAPLGTLVAVARWAPGEAVLQSSQGEQRFPDLDTLTRESLGEALPLRALPSWLRGQPWPGAASRANDGGFEQLGWQVGLRRFAEGLLEVSRQTPAPAVVLRARLDPPG